MSVGLTELKAELPALPVPEQKVSVFLPEQNVSVGLTLL